MMLYDIYVFFVSAIHVAEYTNELLFFGGEGLVEAETYKIEASHDCTCFLFGLAAGSKIVSRASKNIVPASDFQGSWCPQAIRY